MRPEALQRSRTVPYGRMAQRSPAEVFRIFLRLGFTSFGGPVAHLGYFRAEFVDRRVWLSETSYADVVALCQFLPGPASSQVAVSLGVLRAGLMGGIAAWLGFTLPSAVALIMFAYGVGLTGDLGHASWLHGLKIVAVAVVAQAVWGMARNLCPDRLRASVAVVAAAFVLAVPSSLGQVTAIAAGAAFGWWFLREAPRAIEAPLGFSIDRRLAVASLAGFLIVLAALPFLVAAIGDHALDLVWRFYRSGALVFGGGHVVLPLLADSVVTPGWIGSDAFLAGYGAAQAVPGPLFTFAAYLGTAMTPSPNGWIGGLLCLVAIYLPSFPAADRRAAVLGPLRRKPDVQAALRGVNATVVGVLLAALYTPVWTSGIAAPRDFAMGIAAFLLLVFWRVPPWLVVILGAAAASVLA